MKQTAFHNLPYANGDCKAGAFYPQVRLLSNINGLQDEGLEYGQSVLPAVDG